MQKTRKPMFYGRLGKNKNKKENYNKSLVHRSKYKEIRKLYIQNRGA